MERPKIQQQFSDLKVSRGQVLFAVHLTCPGAWTAPDMAGGHCWLCFSPNSLARGWPCFCVFSSRVCVQKPLLLPPKRWDRGACCERHFGVFIHEVFWLSSGLWQSCFHWGKVGQVSMLTFLDEKLTVSVSDSSLSTMTWGLGARESVAVSVCV